MRKTNSSSIEKAYDAWAEVYDSNDNATRDLNYRAIRTAALLLKDKNVLELGCGTGLNTEYLAAPAQRMTCVDFSVRMLAKARRRVSRQDVKFIKADITKPWEFAKESFDVIIANLILEHVEKLSFVFEEASRVLVPGGQLYIAELHPYKQLRQSQARYIDKLSGKEVLVEAFRHSVSEFVNAGLAAGLILKHIGEQQNEEDDIPRLLTLLFKRPA